MKMKLTFIILVWAIPGLSYSQSKHCDCSEALSQDLKDFNTSTEYRDFKDWLYTYYQKDETTRTQLKKSSSNNWSAAFEAVIRDIPISESGGNSKEDTKDTQKYSRVEQSFLKNRYITDQELNELFVSTFSDNQLKGYLGCLNLCEQVIGNGVFYYTGGETNDEFYLQVRFSSTTGGNEITLDGDAVFSNLLPIGGLVFSDGLIIKDRQSKTQYFKRIDPTKKASFAINVKERISIEPIVLEATAPINQQAIPIGTIVASVLDYKTFLKANNLDEMDNSNMDVVLWIPCDGRTLNKSKYANYSGGSIPDLRGVFLRGINDYGIAFPTTSPVKANQRNPENTVANQFQPDTYKSHQHGFGGNFLNAAGNRIWDYYGTRNVSKNWFAKVNGSSARAINKVSLTSPECSTETRPKNVTVYYYIKIN